MESESESVNWKEIGNQSFQEKKYEDAIVAYTKGLKVTPSDISLLSNRALNYLHVQLFSQALDDADAVLKLEPKHVKALYRKVKALIGAKKYRVALEFILTKTHKQLLNSYDKETKIGDELLTQVEKLVEQELTGNYNMADILKEQTFEHVLADFNGPLALEEFKNRGRGLVATEKVETGQLLIGSKAFAFIVERKNRPIASNLPLGDTKPPGPISVDRAQAKASLVEAITQKVKKCPEEARVLYTLFAGSKLGHLDLDDSCSIVDTDRIKQIVECNALVTEGRVAYEYKELMAGLWLFPSFINHSCYDGNVKWHMHGDFLAVIAIKDIKPGEELRMSYVSPMKSLKSREKLLLPYEFRCNCSLCEFQREVTFEQTQELKEALKKYEALLELPGTVVTAETTELEGIVEQLEKIHPENLSKCPFLLEPYKVLAKRHFRAGNYDKSIEILENGRKLIVGTEFTDELLTFTTNLISAHLKNKDKKSALNWIEVLKKDVKICYGSPVDEVLQVIAPDLIKKLKTEKISII